MLDPSEEGSAIRGRYRGSVPPRSRIVGFGSAALLVVAGVACGLLVGGLTGQVLLIALIALGLGAALLLVFLEVGLSEDQEREREERRRPPGPR
jgi:hypothetical protein